MDKPLLIRRGAVIEELGISKHSLTRLIDAGRLHPTKLHDGGKSWFLSDEVDRLKEEIKSEALKGDGNDCSNN